MIKNKTSLRGFTLLELIVVIAIIGVLSVIIIPSFTTALARSRDGRKVSELSGLQKNFLQWAQNNNGFYPGDLATTTVPTSVSGCTTAMNASSWCAIIASGIDTRLPSGVWKNSLSSNGESVYHYAGVGCSNNNTANGVVGLCNAYQLWTNLEQTNVALQSDVDSGPANMAVYPTSVLTGTMLATSTLFVNASTETCTGAWMTCVFDLVP